MLKRPMPVMQLRMAAASLLVLALGAACGGDESAVVASTSNGNGPVVAHPAEEDGSGASAQIEGPLSMSSGCLLVGGYPVVWPYGTTWDADAQAVRLSDGQVVALGDRVSGGGGYPHLPDLGTEFAEPLTDCPTNEYEEVAMFNAGDQITVTK
ncbi:hypothetical protein [Nocardioides sp. zg-1228]|uniref:hypothetical protein n=1 Tax=Nocardioides sp. zg-1228 TaxID=2763008 RepID=UPI001642EDDE|nr:hypothetical protein [Nocardioides sp. zg-1228]MBC2934450.1 hypothetical protein [Nocardioides sp. zg-1228]QSF59216.1 hypothetical protein JX575_08685 [Nocardioides sp. zg-1228]